MFIRRHYIYLLIHRTLTIYSHANTKIRWQISTRLTWSIIASTSGLEGSTCLANFRFWAVYSCPQYTRVLSGSVLRISIRARYIWGGVPSKKRPHPAANSVSPEDWSTFVIWNLSHQANSNFQEQKTSCRPVAESKTKMVGKYTVEDGQATCKDSGICSLSLDKITDVPRGVTRCLKTRDFHRSDTKCIIVCHSFVQRSYSVVPTVKLHTRFLSVQLFITSWTIQWPRSITKNPVSLCNSLVTIQ